MSMLKNIMFATVLLAGSCVVSKADFYVIPITKKVDHVILVAKNGGDFTDVKTAIDSISDANETNRYLVYVGPGVYEVTAPIVLKEWVTLKGSGRKATKLEGHLSSATEAESAIVIGAPNTEMTELSIVNSGGHQLSIGIYNNQCSPIISNIDVTVFGGDDNRAIYNYDHSSPIIHFVNAVSTGGSESTGIYNHGYSSPRMTNVSATAEGAGVSNSGIRNINYSHAFLTNVKARGAQGDGNNYGVYNSQSSPRMESVVLSGAITGAEGSKGYGVYNDDTDSYPQVLHSVIYASTDAVEGGVPECHYTIGSVGRVRTYSELDDGCEEGE